MKFHIAHALVIIMVASMSAEARALVIPARHDDKTHKTQADVSQDNREVRISYRSRQEHVTHSREIRMFYRSTEGRARRETSRLERARWETRTGERTPNSPADTTRSTARGYRDPRAPAPSQTRDSNASPERQPEATVTQPRTMHGIASWYGREFHGRRTANGEVYDMHRPTAAHRTLPFGTIIRVTNLRNGRQTLVRINDRGPFVAGREIDLSYRAAYDLGMLDTGLEMVRLEILSG